MKKMEHSGIAVIGLAQVVGMLAIYLVSAAIVLRCAKRHLSAPTVFSVGTYAPALLIVTFLWIALAVRAKKRGDERDETVAILLGIIYGVLLDLGGLAFIFHGMVRPLILSD